MAIVVTEIWTVSIFQGSNAHTISGAGPASFLGRKRHKGNHSGGFLLFLWFLASDDRQCLEFQTLLLKFIAWANQQGNWREAGYKFLCINIRNILF